MNARDLTGRIRAASSGVRFRTTLFATVAVGIALAITGLALVSALRSSLTSSIQATAESRARDLAALVEKNAVPVPIPGRGEALLAQVIDADGSVISSTPDISDEGPMVDVRLDVGEMRVTGIVLTEAGGGDQQGHTDADRAILVGVGVEGPNGPATVLVAASLESVTESVNAIGQVLTIVLPIVLLVIAGTVWVLTGRALAPVEAIRSSAATIGAEALGQRVPVPASHDEIGRLALTMNEMLDRLDESAQSQRRFVADASHELRSPIAAIRTMLEVAERHPGRVDTDTLVKDLLREDLRLERLTADLLTLARHDERALSMRMELLQVCPLLAEEVASVQSRSHMAFSFDIDDDGSVIADRGRLLQVIRNLMDNALRHAATGIWVSCKTEGRFVKVTVSDDGTGIPLDDRERIFERFVRLDDARSRAEGGTGLGLAVCRVLVAEHRGTIRCVDPLHGGATFEMTLPLTTG